MKLAVVGFLAAFVAAPLAAEAAEAPTRWSTTLDGRIVETLSFSQSTRDDDCTTTRLGTTRRVSRYDSLRPTAIAVVRSAGRASYRPNRVVRVRFSTVITGSWSQRRVCRAAPIETSSGSCDAKPRRAPIIRLAFRWSGPNRVSFRRGFPSPVVLCGFARTVQSDAGLSLAPGRVDEELLLRGTRRAVAARADTTRSQTLDDGTASAVGQEARVTWTLTFRRR